MIKEKADAALDKVALAMELALSTCDIDHGGWTPAEECPAVEFLSQHFGPTLPDGSQDVKRTMHIAVCQDCLDVLTHKDPEWREWLLMVCAKCGSAHWMIKSVWRQEHPDCRMPEDDVMVQWLPKCLNCEWAEEEERRKNAKIVQ